ncbi:hypothetical protein HYDPIDRAFT_28112 [Hydnomerulius pinastri MD-312]|uniref:Uncharacterized protein n=1 Tax=Hydnomerulius pinastri MD-312 TaxID=994086 RepID=A0A0C9WA50_9AGAM|nr:hypothetical protein HYDPIDRAFT_28112 [Hydnomerulius pinastri MD-312]
MSSSGIPPSQRARTKTSDLSEIFRSAHGSRHSSKAAAATGSSPTSVPVPALPKPRRSMLPFLGRKKPVEQSAGPSTPPRKSSNGPSPVNTVRRSFGNGHTVLMITPSTNEPPLPSTLPPLNVSPPSLGSKFAAHFTPLRSPTKNYKARHSMPQKPPSMPSAATLSPPVPDGRAPSFDSHQSSVQSRSTTPRPLRVPRAVANDDGDDEDFSDLFTQPHHLLKNSSQAAKSASSPTVNTMLGRTSKKTIEASPSSPTPPSSPLLQFPIPPTTIGRPSLALTERGPVRRSVESYRKELASPTSLRSSPFGTTSPKGPHSPPIVVDSGSVRATSIDITSENERRRTRNRAASHSGSDTDASRAYDSSPRTSNFKQTTSLPKPSGMKPPSSYQPPATKASNGPPPSAPLPSPPLSTPGSVGSANNSSPTLPPINNVASRSSTRLPGVSPRPRANTLSITSNLNTPRNTCLKPNTSSPSMSHQSSSQDGKANTGVMPDASPDDLRDALTLQRKKYAQLQEYVVTITKRYEDDRVALTKTIEKLERDIRKKTKEIEGLRWLVIHNGGVGDIDAAANLARSSLSTQDDGHEAARLSSPSSLKRSKTLPQGLLSKEGPYDGFSSSQFMPGQKGLGINILHTRESSSTLEIPSSDYTVTSSATSSQSSLSLPALTPSTTTSLSAIPEQPSDIPRGERQNTKEERRATRALRRISASSISTLSSGINLATHPPSPDHSFDPKQSMDEVLERLRPFGNT